MAVFALVILFAVYAFIEAGLEAVRAFSSRTAGPVFGHLLLGLISLAAGVVAVVWPAPTALVLVLVIGIWAVVEGERAMAYGHAERNLALIRQLEAETRRLLGSLDQLDPQYPAWLPEVTSPDSQAVHQYQPETATASRRSSS